MWTNAYSTEEIGAFIAAERRANDRTQSDLAEDLGVSRATVSSLENGGAVSAQLLVRALGRIGARLVIVPKDASVSVVEPETR